MNRKGRKGSKGLSGLEKQAIRPFASLAILFFLTISVMAQTQRPLAGYSEIVIEPVAIEQSEATARFPADYAPPLHEKMVEKVRGKGVFQQVLKGPLVDLTPAGSPREQLPAGRRLILTATIIEYAPGNKALRYTIGWGTGATRIKVRASFRDAATGQEILQATLQGKFLGFINVIGSKRNHAVSEASGDIVDGLLRAISKNR